MDELSLGLAPIIVERMLPVVRRYATENGAGVLHVEQHVELGLEVSDRGIAMSHGEIILERPAAELRGDRSLSVMSYFGVRQARENCLQGQSPRFARERVATRDLGAA